MSDKKGLPKVSTVNPVEGLTLGQYMGMGCPQTVQQVEAKQHAGAAQPDCDLALHLDHPVTDLVEHSTQPKQPKSRRPMSDVSGIR